MSLWHFDFRDPTAVPLQMSHSDINSHWAWAECADSVVFVGPLKSHSQCSTCVGFRLLLSAHANCEPSNDFAMEWEKNSRQMLKQDRSQGNLSHNGFVRILRFPSVRAIVNIAFKECLCEQCWLQTSVYSQGIYRMCMACPQWNSARRIDLSAQEEDYIHFTFQSIFVSSSGRHCILAKLFLQP